MPKLIRSFWQYTDDYRPSVLGRTPISEMESKRIVLLEVPQLQNPKSSLESIGACTCDIDAHGEASKTSVRTDS